MKHSVKITLIILGMFLLTQFIGLIVVNEYSPKQEQVLINGTLQNVTIEKLPEGFQPPEGVNAGDLFKSMIIAFIFAVVLLLVLMKFGLNRVLRYWFFIVVIIAIGLFFNAILRGILPVYSFILSLILAIPLAFYKIFKRDILIHNITELMIYPGIAAVLVPLFIDNKGWLAGKLTSFGLNLSSHFSGMLLIWPVVLILILISIYDMWAVWHSKIMIKMAKFQMNEVKIFAGFFIPYTGKKEREQIQLIKSKYKTQKSREKALSKKKIKVNLAILGGGDVVFPIIAAGTVLRAYGLVPALIVIFGALAGLTFLFTISEKKKFYPAMPFITAGIFLGMLLWWVMRLLL